MGSSINHMDRIVDIFDPPPLLWTNMVFWPTPLENHVGGMGGGVTAPSPKKLAVHETKHAVYSKN